MLIRTVDLKRVYRTEEVETTALDAVNLEIDQGELVSIMGPSGSGKSTLLNVLGLLDNPTSGQYYFRDQEVSRLSERQCAQHRKGRVGFVFQSFNLIDELKVTENVELPLLYSGVAPAERDRRAREALARVGMDHRLGHYPAQLSGGQQQRVAVARAIVSKPLLILADEPTGNLDSVHGQQVMDLLRQLNEDGTTIVMVTHSEEYAAYGHRTLNLRDGQLEGDGHSAATA